MARCFAVPAIMCMVVACVFAPASAAESEWVNVGLGGGGGTFVPVSSPHDPALMFAASDMSGVYRSTDGGRHWRMLHWRELSSAIVCPVVFDPGDPDMIYAVQGPWAAPMVKVSRDRGVTWRNLSDETPWHQKSPQGTLLAVGPASTPILVSSGAGTWRSADSGTTWQKCEGIDNKVISFVFPQDEKGRVCFAAVSAGILRSSDACRTWKPCSARPPGGGVLSFCGGTGKRWDAGASTVIYCSTKRELAGGEVRGGIFRSEDEGVSWQPAMGEGLAREPGPREKASGELSQYSRLGMALTRPDTVYACLSPSGKGSHPPSIFRTDDGGRTWRAVLVRKGRFTENMELGWLTYDRTTSEGISHFYVNAENPDYAAFSNSMELYATSNGGKIWRQCYTECAAEEPGPRKPWRSIGMEMTTTWHYKFDPHYPGRTYICYTDIGFARSTDRGKSWYWAATGSPWKNTFYDLEFDPDKPGVLYAACAYEHDIPSWKMAGSVYGGGGVCRSTNGGASWRPMGRGFPSSGACTAVEIDPESPPDKRILYASFYGGGVFKTDDGGRRWKPVNNGLHVDRNDHFTDIRLCGDGVIYALCGPKKDPDTNRPTAIGGLFKSTDGARTWQSLTEDLGLPHPYGFDVHPENPDIVYLTNCAVPGDHEKAGLYLTLNGGKSWTKLNVPWPPGGPSWHHPKYPCIDPYNPERIWVTTGTSGMVMTSDGGRTWREVKGMPFRPANRVTVDPQDHDTIWVSTFGGGIWKGPAEESAK